MFKALLLENQDGKTVPTLTRLDESQLPAGEVRVAVSYSSLNYKDGLAITGKGKIVRQWRRRPLSAGRQSSADRLGRGGRPLGRHGRTGAGQGRLAGAAAGRAG